jgi:NADH-quinone oxidoreductase subunit C/D
MIAAAGISQETSDRFGQAAAPQATHDRIPTFWVPRDRVPALLRFLKEEVERPYKMLYDLSAIDEGMRVHRDGQPPSDFTVVYHLLSFERNEYVRVKVASENVSLPSVTSCRHRQLVRARSVGHVRIVFDGHPSSAS